MNELSADELQVSLTRMVEEVEENDNVELSPIAAETQNFLYSFAYSFYQNGKFKEAASYFRFLTLVDLHNPKYWLGLGAAQQMLKDFTQAIQAYKTAMVLNETDPYTYFLLADCYFAQGEGEKGLEVLNTVEEQFGKEDKYKPLIGHIAIIRRSWNTKE